MVLKEVSLTATLAWSNTSDFLAAGTAAGSIDVNFSSSPTLQVLSPDFTKGDKELTTLGHPTNVGEPFNRLSWGGLDAGGQMGIIAGGMADGGVLLWDPARLARAATNGGDVPGAQISRLAKHTGAVKGVEFNRHTESLLATGGADGELCIWDVASPASPTLYPALKGGGHGQLPEISALAWNRKVEFILATCSATGVTTVWDLKKQKPVISLRDAAGRMRRCSSVAWNPEVATQLLVACADDLSPTIQLWDLRNNSAPIKELLGHNKGVLSLSWSTHDPSLLLSSARDGRTLLWDVPAGSPAGEMQVDQGWVLEVAWSPVTPGVFASACFGDGKSDTVTISNLASFTAPRTQESFDENFAAQSVTGGGGQPLQKAPTWMKRPVSASLGFGGRLVKAINQKRPLVEGGPHVDVGEIHLSQVVTEDVLVRSSEAFEKAVASHDLVHFCEEKTAQASSDQDKETWAFLRVLFEPESRRMLLVHLGFEDMLETDVAIEHATSGVDELTIGGRSETGSRSGASPRDHHRVHDTDFFDKEEMDGGASFFEELQPQSVPVTPHKTPDVSPRPSHTAASEPPEGEAGESEEAILRALYVGNYHAALDACLQGDRMADALIIGAVAGGELAERSRREYMRRHPRPYMKIVHAVLEGDLLSLVKSRPLDGWRETLALLCAYCTTDDFSGLCDALARRLAAVDLTHPATLVWICAGNVDKAVKHWAAHLRPSNVLELQDLMERAVVLGMGAGQRAASPALADVVNEYASILAAQGRMGMALEYLNMVPGEATSSTAILRDRIIRSGAPGVDTSQAVPFPFVAEDVGAAAAAAAAQAYSTHQQPAATQGPAKPATDYYQRNAYNISGTYGNGVATSYGAGAPAAPPPPPTVTLPPSAYPTAGGYGRQAPAQAPTAYPAPAAANQYSQAQAYGGYGDNYRGGSFAANTAPATAPPPQYPTLAGGGGSGGYAAQLQAPQQVAPPPAVQAGYGATQGPTYGQATNFFTPAAAAPPGAPPMGGGEGGVYVPSRPTSSHTSSQAAPGFVPTPAVAPVPAPAPVNAPPNHFGAPQQYAGQPTPFTPTAPGAAPAAPSAPPTPPAPTGPPPNITVVNADVSKVAGNMQQVVKALRGLFDVCSAAAASAPGKKREMEDNSKRLGGLFWRLNQGDVTPNVAASLTQLAAALESRDLATASQIQVALTASDWDECSTWLTALKRLIKTRQALP